MGDKVKPLKREEVQTYLLEMVDFLKPYLPLANAHASNFIINDYWNTLLPGFIQEELLNLSDDELKTLPAAANSMHRMGGMCASSKLESSCKLENTTDNTHIDDHCTLDNQRCNNRTGGSVTTDSMKHDNPTSDKYTDGNHTGDNDMDDNQSTYTATSQDLHKDSSIKGRKDICKNWNHSSIDKFCTVSWKCSLEGSELAVTLRDLHDKYGQNFPSTGFIGTFMNKKKGHEVEVMSQACAVLATSTQCNLIVDFGSGKGYLGNHLCLQHGLPVLGIDAVITNTSSAERRKTILDKQWAGLTRNFNNVKLDKKLTKKEKKAIKEKEKELRMGNGRDEAQANGNMLKGEEHIGIDTKIIHTAGYNEIAKVNRENGLKNEVTTSFPRYVPVTMYIDKDTDYMELARSAFPELFNEYECEETTTVDEYENMEKTGVHIDSEPKLTFFSSQVETDISNINISHEGKQANNLIHTQRSNITVSDDISDHGYCDRKVRNLKLLLTGLHTCGNLASTSLDLFVHSSDLRTLCTVGCCYHLLDEEFLGPEPPGASSPAQFGFPKSEFLRERNISLGVSARNLASQSVYRMSSYDVLQGERFFPRALLEVVIRDVCGEEGTPGKSLRKLEQKCSSLHEYIRRACDKLKISDKVMDEKIDAYIAQYGNHKHRLAAFFQLRTVLAPCIESVIILDRLCYLLEQVSIKEVFLVKMFDPVISPRCYGILATKS